ncbi:MAG: radical SAM family heme chaperone HemW, partial [Gammaproteobacteria bacterium]|nr:radical SAM family heme chaperone HemW [Gammaproteobacteria bacterium]
MTDLSYIPLGLYIHLPWCVQKCPYCDFNSHELRDPLPEKPYLNALIADLDNALPDIENREVSSIFFGGGTPSLFTPKSIQMLLTTISNKLTLNNNVEITLEANPGTIDAARFTGYRDAGVNRLSLGIQSFNDKHLQALGRIHNAADALKAAESAANIFDNFNLDLMYGLAEQTPEEALADVELAINTGAAHLSCYELTIEPNTVFYKHRPVLPDEEVLSAIEANVEGRLNDAGFNHYEVSAHARSGRKCRHNINYWSFGDYLGIGAGAHSKLTTLSGQQVPMIRREARVRIPQSYIDSAGSAHSITDQKYPGHDDLLFEFMLNALRLRQGFTLDLLTARTGLTTDAARAGLAQASDRGLITFNEDHVQ